MEAGAHDSGIRPVDVDDRDAVRLRNAYFDELRHRLGAFDPPTPDELRADAARGVVLIVYEAGEAVASGSLRRLDSETAEVKRMFVLPEARGRGHGRKLLRALEDAARAMGCGSVVLDTARVLEEAAKLYLAEGYVEVAPYNANPHAARWFRKEFRRRPR